MNMPVLHYDYLKIIIIIGKKTKEINEWWRKEKEENCAYQF